MFNSFPSVGRFLSCGMLWHVDWLIFSKVLEELSAPINRVVQGEYKNSTLFCSTLKMETVYSSETLVPVTSPRPYHVPEERSLH